jgi:hypothetical protein
LGLLTDLRGNGDLNHLTSRDLGNPKPAYGFTVGTGATKLSACCFVAGFQAIIKDSAVRQQDCLPVVVLSIIGDFYNSSTDNVMAARCRLI